MQCRQHRADGRGSEWRQSVVDWKAMPPRDFWSCMMERATGGRGNERESGLERVLYWTHVQLVFLKKRIWSKDRGLLSALEVISPVQDHILHPSLSFFSLSAGSSRTPVQWWMMFTLLSLCPLFHCLLVLLIFLLSFSFISLVFVFFRLPPLFLSSSHPCIPRQCWFMMAEQSSLVHAVYIIHHEVEVCFFHWQPFKSS